MRTRREDHREAKVIWRARVLDAVSRDEIGRFSFSADSVEEARERGWRIAGRRFGSDNRVRIERLSR